MRNIKVSIILPSLNVVKYIEECIKSVINQSLKEIEIICVDAGSTDGTLEILQEYEKQDERIKLIVVNKKSYGYQMNLGIAVATGEYIGIVETDDYVPQGMYEELYAVAKENDVDFVKADFYRFTGCDENIRKVLYKLSNDTSVYNRIVDIKDEQCCFYFPMNTWSGIYNREFLNRYNILHNETPGASFQDNGFWFQTFVYAKRAYFMNKAYYMNRRDNPTSSVYNKEKVFCICDEYNFIFDVLQKNPKLFAIYKYIYAHMRFVAYKANLERIDEKYKLEFLKRMSCEFSKLRELGVLDYRLFDDENWSMLISIIENPQRYYEYNMTHKQNLYELIHVNNNIIIYGAGVIGKKLLNEINSFKKPADILCFAVSKKDNNLNEYGNVPIYDIHDLTEYKENSLVVIATSKIYQREMKKLAQGLGFQHIVTVLASNGKDEMYYKELSEEQYPKELEKWYASITGKRMDISYPHTFNEKLQWLKIFEKNTKKAILVDKVEFRRWIETNIGEEYLVSSHGVYNFAEEIPFNELPQQFVIKTSHSCGRTLVIQNKTEIERTSLCRKLNSFLAENYAYISGLNLAYRDIKPKILIEKMLDKSITEICYKVLCFNGVVKYIVCDSDRGVGKVYERTVYDIEWNKIPLKIKYDNHSQSLEKPKHLLKMVNIAEEIAEGCCFTVVEFWNTKERPLISKIKYTLGNGVEQFYPEYYNEKWGELILIR